MTATNSILHRILVLCLLTGFATASFAQTTPARERIDRHALVSRHDIVIRQIDPLGALAVGNGEFAFNVDVTGLQSFPEYYEKTMPIGLLSTWGWHSFPNPNGYTLDKFKFMAVKRYSREVFYPASSTTSPPPDAAYLRANPHRYGLGRIGLEMTRADGSKVAIEDLTNIEQKLDLWGGILTSSFEVEGAPVRVETAAHPTRDEVGVRIESPLINSGRLKVRLAFPYPSGAFGLDYQDWTKPEAHQTVLIRRSRNEASFARTMDGTRYDARAKWSAGSILTETQKHQFLLSGSGNRIELTVWFSSKSIGSEPDSVAGVQAASRDHWKRFWSTGGAIDLSGTDDPRAAELERRIVLSQFVMAVHDAGSWPPQETGLAANSWFGKFHMEMYWWHMAHFALWGRPELLERSFRHLPRMLPAAQAMARREGCKGAKWSKMTDPSGIESPSGIGPMLVWQQPHPIHLAELLYRAHKDRATLERYKEIVFETADYMASFMEFDPDRKQYVLGPGVGSADERYTDFARNLNPTMELGYWQWALETAQQWRVRLGLRRDKHWDTVLNNFAPLPVRNGVYPTLELPQEGGASWMATWLYGILPGKGVDKEVMARTLERAAASRTPRVQATVTWGIPMVAMCAARMGQPDLATQLLVNPYEKNPFLPSGYAYRNSNQTPMYMPANGGWLAAAAMMAAGWDPPSLASYGETRPPSPRGYDGTGGGPKKHAPGFPESWKVRYEGLLSMP